MNRPEYKDRNRSTLMSITTAGVALLLSAMMISRQGIAAQPQEAKTPSGAVLPQSSIPLITAGTPARDAPDAATWNRLVLIAAPKLNSGDIENLGETVRDAASQCSLTLMADIRRTGEGQAPFKIVRFGVGNAMNSPSGPVIVSLDSAESSGVSLNFITRQVLSRNQQRLKDVILIAQTDTMVVFDAPSMMLRRDSHRKYITRHLAYIDPVTGKGATMIWLLTPPDEESRSMSVINHPIRIAKWGLRETRNIHVDAAHFNFMGIPSDRAFALEDLPPGTDVPWSRRAARVAGQKQYTRQQLQELSDAMRESLTASLK